MILSDNKYAEFRNNCIHMFEIGTETPFGMAMESVNKYCYIFLGLCKKKVICNITSHDSTEWRSKGKEFLYQCVNDYCKEAGIKEMFLDVLLANTDLFTFHSKIGFKTISTNLLKES